MSRPDWITQLVSVTGHTPASHYGQACNAYAQWYLDHIDHGALFSSRYRFARAMVDQALTLGWIPSETPLTLAECTCDPIPAGSRPPAAPRP